MPHFTGWDETKELDSESGQAIVDEFLEQFVKKDFAAKFIRDFNGRKSIGPRYLKPDYNAIPYSNKAPLEILWKENVVCPIVVEEITDVRHPEVLRKLGYPPTLQWLFYDQGDALARVTMSKQAIFLFLPHDSSELLRFPRFGKLP